MDLTNASRRCKRDRNQSVLRDILNCPHVNASVPASAQAQLVNERGASEKAFVQHLQDIRTIQGKIKVYGKEDLWRG